jgi:hypothetical protein
VALNGHFFLFLFVIYEEVFPLMTNEKITQDTVLYSMGFWGPFIITVLCLLDILVDLQFAFILTVGISAMLIIVGYAAGKRKFAFIMYAFLIIIAAVFALTAAWAIFTGLLSIYAFALAYLLFVVILTGISYVVE